MPDPTAAERARLVIDAQIDHVTGANAFAAQDAVDTLLADPSLLFDLAEEAGALEQVGWCHRRSDEVRIEKPWYGPYELIEDPNHDGEQFGDWPVYRRVEGERDG